MRKHLGLFTVGAAALALTLGIGPAFQSAQAEFFEYDATVTATGVAGIGSVSGNGSNSVTLTTSGGETIVLDVTPSTGAPHSNATGFGTDIVFSTIDARSVTDSTTLQNPITFDFTYTLNITDYASPSSATPLATGSIDITGRLSGSIGNGRAVNLNNLQSYATNPLDGEVLIGNTLYTVSVGAFTPPGTDRLGTFGAHVQARAVPEPVSVISTAMGFLALGGFLARGRRRNRKAQAA